MSTQDRAPLDHALQVTSLATNQHEPTIGVVICAYTEARWDDLVAGATAIQGMRTPGDELVVVIDYNEPLLKRARAFFGPDVQVIMNSQERGLSGARNSGVLATQTDIVAFLDDDARPLPGWVAAYRARFTSDPAIAAVGGAIRPSFDGGREPRWFPMEYGWVIGCDYIGLPGDGQEIRNPIGASMAVRRSHVDLVGGFSTRVGRIGAKPTGNDETELAIRIRQADPAARIVRDTAPVVMHRVPEDRQTPRYFLKRCFYEGRSKSALSDSVGSADALSAERAYIINTLVRGTWVHIRDGVARRELRGLARAAMLWVGLFATATGYLTGRARGLELGRGRQTGVEQLPAESPA